MLDAKIVSHRLGEARELVADVPEQFRREALTATLTVLLAGDMNLPLQMSPGLQTQTQGGVIPQVSNGSRKVASIRQLARFTRRKGVTGDQVALGLAVVIRHLENRPVGRDDFRKNWAVLTTKIFATTWPLNAEKKGWLMPVNDSEGNQLWVATQDGIKEFEQLVSDQNDEEAE